MGTCSRKERHERIRKSLKGTADRPRVVVFRSNKNIYTQLIDDSVNKVIGNCSTISEDFKAKKIKATNKEAAKEVGKMMAVVALKLGLKEVCFDRAGYNYHGRVQAVAEGLREGGLKF
ncbi:MAG: 50S ribosomal protein L18 [Candidatus Omnitrophica bacterium]|nr:50S ribosomal protein L18 [Candidatus Omnitrophota bacterium]